MALITVYTSTYNRSKTLIRTYESLLKQTCTDFEWLVVDDGSTDDTADLVSRWIDEGRISMRLIRKENGGLHSGYNVAIANISTELCMCCDSDDYLPVNAISTIKSIWCTSGGNQYAGIIGLDFYAETQKPIGGYFSDVSAPIHFLDLTPKLHHRGDVKMVHRTELLKRLVPMPTFDHEKNFNPIYLFLRIDPELKYILTNENLCFVDYQSTGMSANILRQFRNSPRSFAELRRVRLLHPGISSRRKFIDAAHLVSSALIARRVDILKNAPQKWRWIFSMPLGICFFIYIMYKTRMH